MSRLIKKPIILPEGVTVVRDGDFLAVKGFKGELKVKLLAGAEVVVEDQKVWVKPAPDVAVGPLLGTLWSLIHNAVKGVTEGFVRILEIEGVGYRAVLEGKELVLFLGYAQPVRVKIPEGVTALVEKNTMTFSGLNKDLVGRVAAGVRALKKPEPYKGKGIHYQGEVIRRKVGKKAGATATA